MSGTGLEKARRGWEGAGEGGRAGRLASGMAGRPGAFDRYDLPGLARILERYAGMTHERLRENLKRFLEAIIPTAEEVGIRMCIHPDAPPRPPFGLLRNRPDEEKNAWILGTVAS